MGSTKKVTKKATKATPRISPKIPDKPLKYTQYEDLVDGDCFIMDGRLYIKCDDGEQESVNLNTGVMIEDCCDYVVIPVDIKITWKKK